MNQSPMVPLLPFRQFRAHLVRHWVLAGALLAVSLVLFRLGDNYNWITAAAIIVAVAHWIVLVKSFEPEGGASATG